MAEVWAENRPTLIKTTSILPEKSTSPYLTNECGSFWITKEELYAMLDEYLLNPKKFLNKYSPYEYVRENLSDEASVKKLMKIIKQI